MRKNILHLLNLLKKIEEKEEKGKKYKKKRKYLHEMIEDKNIASLFGIVLIGIAIILLVSYADVK